MRSFVSVTLVTVGTLVLVSSQAAAKPVVAGLPSTAGGPCGVADVMFRGAPSDQCAGAVTTPQNDMVGGPTSAGWTVNTIPVLGGNWEAMVRDEGAPASTEYEGISWTLDATNDAGAGDWSLTWLDTDPATLPLKADLMVVLKGGTAWSAYLFNTESFFPTDLSDSGSFAISFRNNGGNIPGLSHMSLYFRNGSSFACEPGDIRCVPPCERNCEAEDVPEPTSLALLGIGLFGTGLITRRRR